MVKNTQKRTSNRIVPSPWVAKIRGEWAKATEFETEFRVGTRGAWRPVPGEGARLVVSDVMAADGETTELGVEQAGDYAQTLFDACHHHRDEEYEETRCDYRMLAWGPDKEGKGRVEVGEPEGRGGRLGPENSSEDVPNADAEGGDDSEVGIVRGLLREFRYERKQFVDLLLLMAAGLVEQAENSRSVVADGIEAIRNAAADRNNLELGLKELDLKAYRTQEASATLNNMGEKFAPAATTYAQARYQESVNDRNRKPSGDAVKDKFLLLVDGLDPLTFATVEEKLPADVFEKLRAIILNAEVATSAELVAFWAELREPLKPHWGVLMGALPEPVRRALSEFAYAVEEAEKKGKAEA